MAKEPDLDVPVTVREDDVDVVKSFAADRFPVPAITFTISSAADEPVHLRLVDEIPDSFSMEGIGFHPDYESDNWTAYRDHRVEYVRTLEPGEEVETVYGVRVDDLDRVEEFVREPTVELLDESATSGGADGVLGRDTTQVVRDALAGDQGLPGLDDEPLLGGGEDEEPPAPRSIDSETVPAVTRREERASDPNSAAAESPAADPPVEAASETADPDAADESVEAAEETGATSVGAAAPETAAVAEAVPEHASELDGVAAALADEIRAGDVADEDLELLREKLDFGAPKSVDVRIGRLQSQVEDLLAYRDALADFLDDHGTADDVFDEFQGELDSLESRLADVDASLSAAATERTDLREDVSAVRETVETVESQVATLDEEMGEVREDIAGLDERLVDVEEDVRAELDDIQAELEDLREFRDRLSSAFGTE
ncbi:hypothetical protein [Salinirarus marinus]|uniref:hypothetical protein n=1 Tax=Salinirarus marinus TaxID=3068310 RepID=UPI003C6C40F0